MKQLISILVLLCIAGGSTAFAWGWSHSLISYLAHDYCTETTNQVLDRYLDVPLVDVGSWMDQFRSKAWEKKDCSDAPNYTFTSYRHAVSVDENCYPLTKSNRPDGNGDAYGALLNCIDTLKNYRNLPDSTVIVNIKFICHIVGDLSCPGHILHSFDKDHHDPMGGGLAAGYGIWEYTYEGKNTNLHKLLDNVADRCHPEFNRNPETYAAYLDSATPEERRAIADMSLYDWVHSVAKDSKQIFRWEKPGTALNKSYYDAHEPYLMSLLRSSAYKLADILNELFDPEYKTL